MLEIPQYPKSRSNDHYIGGKREKCPSWKGGKTFLSISLKKYFSKRRDV